MNKTNIYQMVADALDEEPITDITDDTKFVNWMNRNYDTYKQSLLSMGVFSFSKKRVVLLPRVDTPAFGWSYGYDVPTDLLRLFPLTEDGEPTSPRIRFTVEGTTILTNKATSLSIRYVFDADESLFSPIFTRYLVAELALSVTHWMTGKVSYVEAAERRRKAARRDALLANAQSTYPEDAVISDSDVVRSIG